MNDYLYLDQVKKLAFYKQFIVDEYLKKGKVIDKLTLEAKLDDIDTKLAIFSEKYVENGSTLNVDEYNRQKNDLYMDLCILYGTLFELAEKRLSDVEHKLDLRLEAVTERARKLQSRAELESMDTPGQSLFYKDEGFEQRYENGKVYIGLGSMSIPSGSYLSCICDSEEAESKDIVFRFGDDYQTVDYRFCQNYLSVAGNFKILTNSFSSEEEKTDSFKIDYDNPVPGNSYNLFAGRSKLRIKHYDTGIVEYVDKLPDIYYTAQDDCEIAMYVYGASFISTEGIGETTYSSFDGYEINSPKLRQELVISCKAGYRFDIVTDGDIYAEKCGCTVAGGELFSDKGFPGIYDYMLEEISYGEDIVFDDVVVIIDNPGDTFLDINYIAIKQVHLAELEDKI